MFFIFDCKGTKKNLYTDMFYCKNGAKNKGDVNLSLFCFIFFDKLPIKCCFYKKN